MGGGTLTMIDCSVDNNFSNGGHSNEGGGGMRISGSSTVVTLIDSSVVNNAVQHPRGPGVHISGGATMFLINSNVQDIHSRDDNYNVHYSFPPSPPPPHDPPPLSPPLPTLPPLPPPIDGLPAGAPTSLDSSTFHITGARAAVSFQADGAAAPVELVSEGTGVLTLSEGHTFTAHDVVTHEGASLRAVSEALRNLTIAAVAQQVQMEEQRATLDANRAELDSLQNN